MFLYFKLNCASVGIIRNFMIIILGESYFERVFVKKYLYLQIYGIHHFNLGIIGCLQFHVNLFKMTCSWNMGTNSDKLYLKIWL